jgi:hypothetical protein
MHQTRPTGIVGRGRVFSPDSKRTAYRAKRRAKYFVVVDGSESEPYDRVEWRSIVFSPDSRHVAYIAANKGSEFIVVDGVKARGFDAYLDTSVTRQNQDIPVDYADGYDPLVFARKDLLYGIGREGNKILRTEVQILER